MLVDFLLPVYNEEKILKDNVLRLHRFIKKNNFQFDWRLVIVVNGSNDSSLNIAERLSREFDNILVYSLKNAGKGRAIKSYAGDKMADIAAYMDIDLAVSLKDIPNLIKAVIIDNYDLAVGSRYLPGSVVRRSYLRSFISIVYNFIARKILRNNFTDLQCGFKAIKREAFKKIMPYVKNEHWFFDTELIVFADKFNFEIKEIPVNWSESRYERRKSKAFILSGSVNFIFKIIELRRRINNLSLTNSKNKI